MDRDRIINIVQKVKASKKNSKEELFKTFVEIDEIHEILEKKLLSTLEKEWKINNIDIKELDWDWKKAKVEWYTDFTFSRESYLDITLKCPDQKIEITGEVEYYHEYDSNTVKILNEDEKGKSFSYSFDLEIDIKDVEVDLDVSLNDRNNITLSPKVLEYYKNKWKLVFE